MMISIDDKDKEKVELATDVRFPASPIITSKNVPNPLVNYHETNQNILQEINLSWEK